MKLSTKTLLATIAAIPLATAQTSTSCNPLDSTSCSSDAAMGSSLSTTFSGASSLPDGWSVAAGSVTYDSTGAKFIINKEGDAPTIQTSDYFFFGYCEVKLEAASGTGIVSSIVMESDDLDEVDWELLGGDTTQVETNYFGKGDTTTYDRAIYYSVTTPQSTFHTYAVNWTSSEITWLIDGVAVRTLAYSDASSGTRFPQTPMRLKIGIWAGGDPSNSEGTIEWAGGETDYTKGPFTMTVASVNIVNYSPATSYKYGDTTGDWTSIEVTGGSTDSNSNSGSSKSGSSSSSSASVVSGSAAISVSKASSAISSATASGVTSSIVLTQMPLAATGTGLTTSTKAANATSSGNSTVTRATATASSTSSSSSSEGVATFSAGWPLTAGAAIAALFALFF